MGQRSQMYVIVKEGNEFRLVANYYGWNYGERMISRARGVVECILADRHLLQKTFKEKLRRLLDVNWDMHDIVISGDIVTEFNDDLEAWHSEGNTYAKDFYEFVFMGQDNNNGQMYLFADLDAAQSRLKIGFTKYCFTGEETLLTAEEYLNADLLDEDEISDGATWESYMQKSEYYDAETISYTKSNVAFLCENTSLLTIEELDAVLINVSKQYEEKYLQENPDSFYTHPVSE